MALPEKRAYAPSGTYRYMATMRSDAGAAVLPFVTDDFPEPSRIAELLAKEMALMSLEERNEALDDLHGVARVPREDPAVLERQLEEMERHLAAFDETSAYRAGSSYAADRAFRLLFLRAERYDPLAAANRLELHMTYKKKLFGEDKLNKDIEEGDLGPGDLHTLRSGYMEVLPVKDRSGRSIIISRVASWRFYNVENIMRCTWYVLMNALQSSESMQLNGAIYIICYDDPHERVSVEYATLSAMARHACPYRPCALHHVSSNPSDLPVAKFGPYFLEKPLRIRYYAHTGFDNKDIVASMGSFGIPLTAFSLPLSRESAMVSTTSDLELLRQLISVHRKIRLLSSEATSVVTDGQNEEEGEIAVLNTARAMLPGSAELVASSAVTPPLSPSQVEPINPRPNDVLLVRGTRTRHPGNIQLMQSIQSRTNEYAQGNRTVKGHIVRCIVQSVLDSGGRFLRQVKFSENHNAFGSVSWEPADDIMARKKVSNLFVRSRG